MQDVGGIDKKISELYKEIKELQKERNELICSSIEIGKYYKLNRCYFRADEITGYMEISGLVIDPDCPSIALDCCYIKDESIIEITKEEFLEEYRKVITQFDL